MKKISDFPDNLRGVQNYLKELFVQNSHMSFEYVFGYVVRHSGYIAKQVFKQMLFDKNNQIDPGEFVITYSWLFAIANMQSFSVDLGDAFLRKYPSLCPHCLDVPCVCLDTGKKPRVERPAYKVREELIAQYSSHRPSDGIIKSEMIFRILQRVYPNNIVEWKHGKPTPLLKLFEEESELHEAVSKFQREERNLESVSEELADIFAWLTSVWLLIFPGKSLEDAFRDYYIDNCPRCHSFPCVCIRGGERYYGLIDISLLRTIKVNLKELRIQMPNSMYEIDELIKSLGAAIESQTESVTKKAIHQVKNAMENFNRQGIQPPQAAALVNEMLSLSSDLV